VLSVSERTIREWLSRIDKDAKEARDRKIFELWLACWTQEEIAESVGVHKDTADEICRKLANLPKSDKAAGEHATDFEVPLYNIWKQQEQTAGVNHYVQFVVSDDLGEFSPLVCLLDVWKQRCTRNSVFGTPVGLSFMRQRDFQGSK
jgi:hypothetical protein